MNGVKTKTREVQYALTLQKRTNKQIDQISYKTEPRQ
jgi:hypothetical protein